MPKFYRVNNYDIYYDEDIPEDRIIGIWSLNICARPLEIIEKCIHLQYLSIIHYKIKWFDIDILKNLPRLKTIKIENVMIDLQKVQLFPNIIFKLYYSDIRKVIWEGIKHDFQEPITDQKIKLLLQDNNIIWDDIDSFIEFHRPNQGLMKWTEI